MTKAIVLFIVFSNHYFESVVLKTPKITLPFAFFLSLLCLFGCWQQFVFIHFSLNLFHFFFSFRVFKGIINTLKIKDTTVKFSESFLYYFFSSFQFRCSFEKSLSVCCQIIFFI